MFTRHVTMKLRANSAAEFTRLIENEIIPLLRKQKGFRDEVTFVAPGRSEALASSFWDTKEDAEAYGRRGYQEVLKTLSTTTVVVALVSPEYVYSVSALLAPDASFAISTTSQPAPGLVAFSTPTTRSVVALPVSLAG
jgi:hypothetical protein